VPWNRATFDLYLRNPQHLIPGNRMHILGVSDPANRKYLVDWLCSGAPLDWPSFEHWTNSEDPTDTSC
jgi:cytochrome c2